MVSLFLEIPELWNSAMIITNHQANVITGVYMKILKCKSFGKTMPSNRFLSIKSFFTLSKMKRQKKIRMTNDLKVDD